MSNNELHEADVSRRRFIQLMAGATAATVGSVLSPMLAQAASSPKRTVPLPKFNVKHSNKTCFEMHECKPDLKPFRSENMAFKVISEELGISSADAMKENLIRNVMEGKIGHGWPVKDVAEARMFVALNFAATTWNNIIGPYGENRENHGFLSWDPQKIPKALAEQPLELGDLEETTKKIKVIAAYAGADKVGTTKLDRRWMFASACKNGLDPGPAEVKDIVFKEVDQPSETDKEFIIPESVQYAIVIINVQPRALTQIGPSSLAAVTSTNQGYSQGGLTAVALAQAIRSLGYVAIPCMNSTAMSIPLAIDAGLGELGRLGQLITPEWGPHVRVDKVLTNLPLTQDKPITFGVQEYCTECGICAEECPSGAISPDKERTYEPPSSAGRCGNSGALKWYIDGKKCSRWWQESGAPCSNCMHICPYTQATLGDGFDGKEPTPENFWDLLPVAFGRRKIDY